MYKTFFAVLIFIVTIIGCKSTKDTSELGYLKISPNGRFFTTQNGDPFFWLGDTGWLLFTKLNREEAATYFDDRKSKRFDVIQVMVLHNIKAAVNVYGDSALINQNVATPKITPGSSFSDSVQYDFWDHVDYLVDLAAQKGLYLALVPVWGSNVKEGKVNSVQAKAYATFLAERYKDKPNIIWVNGGDIKGSDSLNVWNTIGNTLQQFDPKHLITFHPRGRTQSSTWFHNEPWLSFNMFQSGHRRYDQDTSKSELRYGEDNWKYVMDDYAQMPVKPTLDGEPSYEMIPQGLHDTLQPYWTDNDVRRYAYWSVFAGGAGFTYGDNAVMQFYKPTDHGSAYGAKKYWNEAIYDPGSGEMQFLKKLMLSRPYFDRVPDQSMIVGQGEKYDYLAATRGRNYAFIYTYTGRDIQLNMGIIEGSRVKASWYNPRNGSIEDIGIFDNREILNFNPPGEPENGNDWVLILDSI